MNRLILFLCVLFLCVASTFAQDLSQMKKQKPFSIDGSVSATGNFYNIAGKESTRDPFSYILSGNLNISVYSLQLPVSFTYSNSNFSYSQPFNRFGLSPEYKWIKLHLGYRSTNFSSLTMAGRSFLGAGLELNPGLFRFGAVYGRFNKKTIPNTNNPLDTLQTPTRNGYSVKLGVGSQKNYFDLIFLQIMDDTLSLDKEKYASETPAANTVVGAHAKFTFVEKLTWETEAAISLITSDMSVGEPYAIDNNALKSLVNVFHLNTSSTYSTALTSSLTYSEKLFSLGLQYRRIDPNYESFGAYYFSTDMENATVNTKFRLFNNKVSVSGNIGLQRDNLRNNKSAQSTRLISMANINYNSGKAFSLSASYSDYGVNQRAGTIPLNDTIKLYQSNRNITITPTLTFTGKSSQQMVQLNAVVMDLVDHNPYTAANNEVNSRTLLLNYFLNHIRSGMSFTAGANYTTMASVYYDQRTYGLNADVGKLFLKNKLNGHVSVAVNRSDIDNVMGWINTGTLSLVYKPHKKHQLKLNCFYTQNSYPATSTLKSYNETKIVFSYAYRF